MLGKTDITQYTTISLSTAIPQSDRRDGQRYMSVLQAGKLIVDDRQELCLIRNISAGGLMVEVFRPLVVDQRIQIEFKIGKTASGTVRWIDDIHAGIEFDEPINVHELLSKQQSERKPRSPRVNIGGRAHLRIGEDRVDVEVFDISQGGIKAARDPKLEIGLDVVVSIEGLGIRAGVIRWLDDRHAGISFNKLLSLEDIAFWASEHRTNTELSSRGAA